MIDAFAKWEEKIGIRRTSVLAVTVWMSWRAFDWAASFASTNGVDGTESVAIAAIIAAVTAPVTYLQAAVFKAYLDSKS